MHLSFRILSCLVVFTNNINFLDSLITASLNIHKIADMSVIRLQPLDLDITEHTSVKPFTVTPEERVINLEEVSRHDTIADFWVIIYDRVYDVTEFLDKHPGGFEILLEYAGRDATIAFRGSGHSPVALRLLNNFLVGELPMVERIFKKLKVISKCQIE